MKIISLLGFLFLTGVGITAITLSIGLYRQYRLKYLRYYLYSMIFTYAFGFLDIVAKYLTQGIIDCRTTEFHVITTIGLAFSFIAAPFIVAAWFYLVHMVTAFIGKEFKRVYKIGYFALQVVLIVIFAILIENYAAAKGAQTPELSELILFIFNAVNRGILIFVLLNVFMGAGKLTDTDNGHAARIFAGIYILVFIFHFVLVYLVSPEGALCQIYPVVEFFMHIPPLLYLMRFLRKYYRDHPLQPLEGDDISAFFDKYGLTEREREIAGLILEGKSNREIEAKLFISYATVKTHVYNIYKKLGIKNRWQLINLMQNF
ncbi:MAG: helix-turn-helix transcriptional regulator [bacterium]|nr:helix-turn-helix transcriptional regulator [bacterium]